MNKNSIERRRFIRIEVPLKVNVSVEDTVLQVVTKNISPIGMRFVLPDELQNGTLLSLELYIPDAIDPILLTGKVVWTKRVTLEDNSPFDHGIEIQNIEENNKNVLLKYLCDLLYESSYKSKDA